MIDWSIIHNGIEGTLTEAEKKQLQNWLAESPDHQQLYAKIREQKEYSPEEECLLRWRKTFEFTLKRKHWQRIRRRIVVGGSVAAAIILLVGIGWWYFFSALEPESVIYSSYQEPDRSKVLLKTAEGMVLDLSRNLEQDTLWVDGVKIAKAQKMLTYPKTEEKGISGIIQKNEVEVPRGAEFCLVLSDGSQVWLNSESKLTYPVVFSEERREVQLEGEAYFEVESNEKIPFIVRIGDKMEVTVLGTEFNVNTRNADGWQTVLVRGKVELNVSGKEPVTLSPGELATTDVRSGVTTIVKTNLRKYISWRYGEYFFEEAAMEDILEELSLWYDVEIVYRQEQLRQEKFSGCLPRTESIVSLLNKIEQTTYVHFSLQQNQVVVDY